MPEFTTEEKLKEIKREISMRYSVYGRSGISETQQRQIDIMEAIKADYEQKLEQESTPSLFGGEGP